MGPVGVEERGVEERGVEATASAVADAAPATSPRRGRSIVGGRLAPAAVLVLAAGLRLWAVGADLPYLHHGDEWKNTTVAQRMVADGDPNPHFFAYPSLFLYLQAAPYVPYYSLGRLSGGLDGPDDLAEPEMLVVGNGRTAHPGAVLAGRLVTVVASLALVAVVYALTRRLTGRRPVALLAGALAAASPLLVASGRLITPDTYAALFAAAALAGALAVLRTGRTGAYVVAGAAVGLAASSKYNGVLSAVPVVAAHFCRRGWGGLRDPRLLLSGAAAAGAFVLTTPYALLDTDAFLDGVEAERRHYSTGHAGHEAGAALDYLGAAWRSLGPALVLAAVGAAAWWRRRWREVAVLLAAVVPAFVFISLFEVSFDRNVVPLLPPLTVLAAGGTAVVVDAGVRRWPGRAWWPAVAAVLLVPLVLVSGRDARAANEDERAGARSWIEANVAPGSRLVVEAYGPWIDPERFWVKGFKEVARRPEGFFERRQIDYIVAAEERYGRYLDDPGRYPREAAAYRRLFERYPTAARFGDDGSRIVILQVAPPPG